MSSPVPSPQGRTYPSYQPQTSQWERQTRRMVYASGLRYRATKHLLHGRRPNGQAAFCTPDLTFLRHRVAVFLDGCYWHGCPDHYPARPRVYDRTIDAGLAQRGWRVLRIWECLGAERAADLIIETVQTSEAS